jgi:uncharacterized protein YcbK (DUF882 family)
MKLIGIFKSADLKPLDPVPVEASDSPDEVATILEDIGKVKAMAPRVETVTIDAALFKTMGEFAPHVKPYRRQLTKNFHINEFRCHDGTEVPAELYDNVLELAKNLQALRDRIGKPIKIISGYRHLGYNKKIGGARKSQHIEAKAADIKVKGIGPAKLARHIEEAIADGDMKKGGVGRYPTFTHYDIRGKNARWGGTRRKN